MVSFVLAAEQRAINDVGIDPYSIRGTFCELCGAKGSAETKLHACSSCQISQYCSRSCQKSDWAVHKEMCKDRQRLAKRFDENPILLITPFPGLSKMQSIQSLQKWTYRHISALVWGSVQALQIRNNPEIYKTHVFYVNLALSAEARAGTRLRVKRMFTVVDAVPIERQRLGQLFPYLITSLRVTQPPQHDDVVATAVVRCGDYYDFVDALSRRHDARTMQTLDPSWKIKFLEAVKPPEREATGANGGPIIDDLD